jgi:hypothetical protein
MDGALRTWASSEEITCSVYPPLVLPVVCCAVQTLESFFVQTLRVRSAGVDDLTVCLWVQLKSPPAWNQSDKRSLG